MHDALADIVHGEIFDAELLGITFQRGDLFARFRISDPARAVLGRHVVIGDREGEVRAAQLAARHAKAFERLRARHLMDEVTVDIDDGGFPRRLMHQMGIPDFVVERFSGHFLHTIAVRQGL